MTGYSVLVIGSKDDLSAGWARAQLLVSELDKLGVKTKLVNKLGFVLEDLHLVARYRVVTTPTAMVLAGDKAVYRQLGLPSARLLAEVIAGHRVTVTT